MRVLIIALIAAISYAQTGCKCEKPSNAQNGDKYCELDWGNNILTCLPTETGETCGIGTLCEINNENHHPLLKECPTYDNLFSSCSQYVDGLICEYGTSCCCGECFRDVSATCMNGFWMNVVSDPCSQDCPERIDGETCGNLAEYGFVGDCASGLECDANTSICVSSSSSSSTYCSCDDFNANSGDTICELIYPGFQPFCLNPSGDGSCPHPYTPCTFGNPDTNLPETTTHIETTTLPKIHECPDKDATDGSCAQYVDGMTCEYEEVCCCDTCTNTFSITCADGQWLGVYMDVFCEGSDLCPTKSSGESCGWEANNYLGDCDSNLDCIGNICQRTSSDMPACACTEFDASPGDMVCQMSSFGSTFCLTAYGGMCYAPYTPCEFGNDFSTSTPTRLPSPGQTPEPTMSPTFRKHPTKIPTISVEPTRLPSPGQTPEPTMSPTILKQPTNIPTTSIKPTNRPSNSQYVCPEYTEDFALGSSCAGYVSGFSCNIGEVCCCGQCYTRFSVTCFSGRWIGYESSICGRFECPERQLGQSCGWVDGLGDVGECRGGLECACVGMCADPNVADYPSTCVDPRSTTTIPASTTFVPTPDPTLTPTTSTTSSPLTTTTTKEPTLKPIVSDPTLRPTTTSTTQPQTTAEPSLKPTIFYTTPQVTTSSAPQCGCTNGVDGLNCEFEYGVGGTDAICFGVSPDGTCSFGSLCHYGEIDETQECVDGETYSSSGVSPCLPCPSCPDDYIQLIRCSITSGPICAPRVVTTTSAPPPKCECAFGSVGDLACETEIGGTNWCFDTRDDLTCTEGSHLCEVGVRVSTRKPSRSPLTSIPTFIPTQPPVTSTIQPGLYTGCTCGPFYPFAIGELVCEADIPGFGPLCVSRGSSCSSTYVPCVFGGEISESGDYTCGSTMEECEAAYQAAMTPAVEVMIPTMTYDSCESADGWWVSGTLNGLAGYDAETMSVCVSDGQYMVEVDGKVYATCVAYGTPNQDTCTDASLVCPSLPNDPNTFGWGGNQRSALAAAMTRADFKHPECPTSTCMSMDSLADSGSYWKDQVLSNPYTAVAEAAVDNVCVTPDNEVMMITREGMCNTCLGWSSVATDICDTQKFICAGHSGQGEFTYGWPGQIARTLAVAVANEEGNYMHPQCPVNICSA